MRRWVAAAAAASGLGCGPFYPPGCVARGTRVTTPGGSRRVEELAVGDEVIAIDPESGAFAVARLSAVRSVQREAGALTAAGRTLQVTSDHPLYDPDARGFFPAGDWLLGRRRNLLVFEGARCAVVTLERSEAFAALTDVFDLTVDHAWHTFVAEGVVVHNKSSRNECTVEVVDAGFASVTVGETNGPPCACPSDGGTARVGKWECASPVTPYCAGCSTDGGP